MSFLAALSEFQNKNKPIKMT